MTKFEQFIEVVAEGARGLARDTFSGFEDQAERDARALARKTLHGLMDWTIEHRFKKISKEELCDCVRTLQSVVEMQALARAGIAKDRLEKFHAELVALAIDKAGQLLL